MGNKKLTQRTTGGKGKRGKTSLEYPWNGRMCYEKKRKKKRHVTRLPEVLQSSCQSVVFGPLLYVAGEESEEEGETHGKRELRVLQSYSQ